MENPNLSTIERQERILLLIENEQRITIPQICDLFSVSPATARRDLDTLAEQQKIRRTHGGAIPIKESPKEPPTPERSFENKNAKEQIGKAAAELIHDDETIFIGSGTTTPYLAAHLHQRKNLTVITNSLAVVESLHSALDVQIFLLGGELRRSEGSLIGKLAEETITHFRADKVIIGVRGIEPFAGLTNQSVQETITDRAILKIGKEIIVLADHSKFGFISTAFLAPLSAVHTIVTDSNTPAKRIEEIRQQGIQIIQAGKPPLDLTPTFH